MIKPAYWNFFLLMSINNVILTVLRNFDHEILLISKNHLFHIFLAHLSTRCSRGAFRVVMCPSCPVGSLYVEYRVFYQSLRFGTLFFNHPVYVKYEICITHNSKIMANLKVFTNKQRERRTNRQAKNSMRCIAPPPIYRFRGIKMLTCPTNSEAVA